MFYSKTPKIERKIENPSWFHMSAWAMVNGWWARYLFAGLRCPYSGWISGTSWKVAQYLASVIACPVSQISSCRRRIIAHYYLRWCTHSSPSEHCLLKTARASKVICIGRAKPIQYTVYQIPLIYTWHRVSGAPVPPGPLTHEYTICSL